jgi:phosphopantetheinyl transferase (holo-ACP synthase)
MPGSPEIGQALLEHPATSAPCSDAPQPVFIGPATLGRLLPAGLVLAVSALEPSPDRIEQRAGGRKALAEVMRKIGCSGDATEIVLPHPRLSISHSRDLAVSVGACSPAANGVGVDVEHRRGIRADAARFFLDDAEQVMIRHLVNERRLNLSTILLQLWTVKEAVFKADLANADHMLRDYRIETLDGPDLVDEGTGELWWGTALRAQAVFAFRCIRYAHLTLAIAEWKGTK